MRSLRATIQLAGCLRDRQSEIERDTLVCVSSLSPPPEAGGIEYAEGLRSAVGAGIEYAICGLEGSGHVRSSVPIELLKQAERAARMRVGLDTVLRRYMAAQTLLSDFIVEEGEGRVQTGELKRILRRLGAVVDPILLAVATAYKEEARATAVTLQQRRLELVDGLLAGKPLDSQELNYDLDLHHLGMVASGRQAGDTLKSLAKLMDARLLLLRRDEKTAWGWLGSSGLLDPEEVFRRAEQFTGPGEALAIGENLVGRAGWRLSHLQAGAAITAAKAFGLSVVRYADVAMVSSIMRDELLGASLRQMYLEPLNGERSDGPLLRETLRAYFAAGRNGASAALAIGVTRQTVNHRLRKAEQLIGRPILTSSLELEAALRLDELDRLPASGDTD